MTVSLLLKEDSGPPPSSSSQIFTGQTHREEKLPNWKRLKSPQRPEKTVREEEKGGAELSPASQAGFLQLCDLYNRLQH